MAKTKSSTTTQVGKFGLVGILNTLIDYVLFIGITKLFSIPLSHVYVAKLFSGGVAMINSFYFNRTWVFNSKNPNSSSQAVRFLVATLIGVFLIQTSLTQFFTTSFPYFGNLGFQIASAIGLVKLLPSVITEAFVLKTVAFGLATLASLTWNFVTYRKWVFK